MAVASLATNLRHHPEWLFLYGGASLTCPPILFRTNRLSLRQHERLVDLKTAVQEFKAQFEHFGLLSHGLLENKWDVMRRGRPAKKDVWDACAASDGTVSCESLERRISNAGGPEHARITAGQDRREVAEIMMRVERDPRTTETVRVAKRRRESRVLEVFDSISEEKEEV